jgi:hypothetical protein
VNVVGGGLVLARTLLALLGGAAVVDPQAADETAALVVLSCVGALYFYPGVCKLRAGRRWCDWMNRCQLHYQLIGSSAWGWLESLPEGRLVKAARLIQAVNVPLAWSTVLLELSVVGLPLGHPPAVVLLFGLVVFHAGYFALTGALFWENILVLCSLAVGLWVCGYGGLRGPLGVLQFPLLGGLLLTFPFVFRNPRLTWWETPLTQRVYCQVSGGGRVFALTHRFMGPWEDLFYFGFRDLAPRRLITENLSHTRLGQEIVDELVACGPDSGRIASLSHAVSPDTAAVAAYSRMLNDFFAALRSGKGRFSLPRFLTWLQAPGSFLASGGPGPVFDGQVEVEEVLVKFKEIYFDGLRITVLRDEVLYRIPILRPPADPLRQG